MLIKNIETLICSPNKSRIGKNHDQSTTCFQINKGKSIEFKKQNRRYICSQKCCRDEHRNQNLIFKPIINEIPLKLYPSSEGKNVSKSREEIRERLITDTTKIIHERLKAKFKLQQEQRKEYSFHPKISSFDKQIARSYNNESIHERLFNEAAQIREQKLKIQIIKKEEEKKQIKRLLEYKLEGRKTNVLNEQKHNLGPIENRVKQIVQNRIKLRKKLQQQIEQQKNINFDPKISQKSQKLAEQRIQRDKLKTDVVSRLMEEYQRMKKDKESCLENAKLRQSDQCTFNPQINRNYTFSRLQNDRSLFYDRLKRSHGSCQDEYLQYSFVPKINQMSDLIVLHKRAHEEMETKLQRLSKEPIENKKEAIQKIRRQIQSNFTFRPQLNDITYMMTQACPKSHRCQQPQPEIFSFQPMINQKSKLIRPQRAQSAKLRKKKKILQYKLESEYQELKQCSFHPKINNKRHHDERRLSLVQGVDKFMSFKQRAKQKVEMQKQRQMDLFHLQTKYDRRKDNKIFP